MLPHLPDKERLAFVERMLNVLLLGASHHLSEGQWTRLMERLRDWTGRTDRPPRT